MAFARTPNNPHAARADNLSRIVRQLYAFCLQQMLLRDRIVEKQSVLISERGLQRRPQSLLREKSAVTRVTAPQILFRLRVIEKAK